MNKVIKISINSKNGSNIKFETNDNVTISNLFKLTHPYKEYQHPHYFQCTNIEVGSDNQLVIEAKEVGYWARKFDRITDLDIRTVIGLEVTKIIDPEQIKKVNEASCWC
jgi:ABC-type uncharacterized transport system substrate-binding protein